VSIALVTGSAGLIGSEAAAHFAGLGLDVIGIDNDMRSYFFGRTATTTWNLARLRRQLGQRYRHYSFDLRDRSSLESLFSDLSSRIKVIVHCASQPSHDWAAREPVTDFEVNSAATLYLLEATRRFAPEAAFVFLSTNKVYGDSPNRLPLVELETRWEISDDHPYSVGISESLTIDQSLHSLFGVSKTSADLMVQEYGRYFGLKTVCFRGGCLTGPYHSGAKLHGFLAYLMQCAASGATYNIFGYKGKQVRDNIHSRDLLAAVEAFVRAPRVGEVYNMGGGRHSNCSLLEAVSLAQQIVGRPMLLKYVDEPRLGDHIWWISDTTKFRTHFPEWQLTIDVPGILQEIYDFNRDRWTRQAARDEK